MKNQIEPLPDFINDDQKLYGLCFNDSQNLYSEIINFGYQQPKGISSSRTSLSNTDILFNRPSSASKDIELNIIRRIVDTIIFNLRYLY